MTHSRADLCTEGHRGHLGQRANLPGGLAVRRLPGYFEPLPHEPQIFSKTQTPCTSYCSSAAHHNRTPSGRHETLLSRCEHETPAVWRILRITTV